MQLTMNIIEDALRNFDITSQLTNGSAPLAGIRVEHKADGCAVLTQVAGDIICSYGKDRIEIHHADLAAVINAILEMAHTYELWERDLFHMIFNGCTLQDITEKAYALFQNPVLFIDQTDKVHARTNHKAGTVNDAWDYIMETGYMPFDAATLALQWVERNESAHLRGGRNIPFLFSPPSRDIDNRGINYRLYAPGSEEIVGTLIIIENETPVTLGMLNLSQILADAVDEWLQMHKDDHPFRVVRDIVGDLIENPEAVVNKNVLYRDVPACEDGYLVAVITGCGNLPEKNLARTIQTTLAESVLYKYGEEFVALIPRTVSDEKIADCLHEALYYDGVRAGLSYPAADLSALHRSYHQAKVALTYTEGKISGIRPNIAMKFFTDENAQGIFGADMSHPALETLREYDEAHSSDLYETLYEFLRHERSLVDSAKALNIHRNSLVYRIDKIRQLIDADLDDADIREYMLYSYRLRSQKS